MKIIPSINAQNFDGVKEKINLLKDVIDHFHLDIANLEFTGYKTWQNPENLSQLDSNLYFDLHLMINLKPQEILKWNKENVKTFILHLEASNNPDGLLKMTRKTKKKIFIAWSPNIDFQLIERYLNYINGILILGVNPGKSGQKFIESTYDRIKKIKEISKPKSLSLMIDGGINEENFKKILSYKPDFIIIASAIYNSQNPKIEYLKFKSLINK